MLVLPSAARTSSGAAEISAVPQLDRLRHVDFVLAVTAAAADAGDTLDLYHQVSHDDGATWEDVVHFTQVLGNGGPVRIAASWSRDWEPAAAVRPIVDAALAVGVQQGGLPGRLARLRWVIVDSGDSDQLFTFSVAMRLSWR